MISPLFLKKYFASLLRKHEKENPLISNSYFIDKTFKGITENQK